MKEINRREFIIKGTTIALGTGIMMKTGFGFPSALPKSHVVEVFHPDAVGQNRLVEEFIVRNMLHRGLVNLTGKETNPLSEFIKPENVVGLKINCLGRAMLYTHKELINAMISELKSIGVKENNIIVWDRFHHHMTSCGFVMNDTAEGVRYMATEQRDPAVTYFDPEYVYRSDSDEAGRRDDNGNESRFSSLFTTTCDKIINLAILKDHALAGITLCLKNIAYGICNNNARFHGPEYIGEFIADVYSLPEVREKIVLNIVDGLEGCYNNGPVPSYEEDLFTPNKIWLSRDPVALDSIGLEVIEAKRAEMGYPPLAEIRPGTNHIELAAETGLGNYRFNDMNRIKVNLG